MAFKDVIFLVTQALINGEYQHESRGTIEDKNLLQTGDISVEEVLKVIKRCNGTHHTSDLHHQIKGVDVHILKRDGWYIKFYFLDPETFFISVHQ